MTRPLVIIDDSRSGTNWPWVFAEPISIVCASAPEEVEAAIRSIERELKCGRYVAGYVSYEFGYLLEPRLALLIPRARAVPLLWFGIFKQPSVIEFPDDYFAGLAQGNAYAGPLTHEWNEEAYGLRFRRLHELIAAGDIYQANLSFRSSFAFAGDPLKLYVNLRKSAAAGHCAYVDDGTRQILSLSPELFFSVSPDLSVTARPMKGTTARSGDPGSDAAARAHLQTSDKERAENLMIVDLLRNDLGRIARSGTVSVEELFAIETYPTLHQMVSTITASLKPCVGVRQVLQALFPCGSVTGAPKIRAMEVIADLESSVRGIYCGAIGHFAPDRSAKFNVAIRTLTIIGARGELGIGGAVVHDSRLESEYAECLLKARYFEAARRPLELVETLRWRGFDGFTRLDRHLARMCGSAGAFGIPFDERSARRALNGAVRDGAGQMRVRLRLSEDGSFACVAEPLQDSSLMWRFMISNIRVSSGDLLRRHKTSWRDLYEAELEQARALGCDEVVFLNERGEVTEGSRTNIFVRTGGRLATPDLSCGLLNGCLRQELIEVKVCEERTLLGTDLGQLKEIYLGNSLRGLMRAELVGS